MKLCYTIYILFLMIVITHLSTCDRNDRPSLSLDKEVKKSEQSNIDNPIMRGIPGEMFQAFLAAHEAFLTDSEIPEQKRVVQNYYISIHKESNIYSVYFSAKSKPSEPESLGGETELGKSVEYIVDSRSFKLISKKFKK